MGDKDSVRFLASQLMGLGDKASQTAQQEQSNALQKRYFQLAQTKEDEQRKLQEQQTAVGALDQMVQSKAVNDMIQAKDTDPTHLALYVARAKQEIYNQHPDLQAKLPAAMSGMKIPFYNTRPSPSFTTGPQPFQQTPVAPQGQGRQRLLQDIQNAIGSNPAGAGLLMGIKGLGSLGSSLMDRYKNF